MSSEPNAEAESLLDALSTGVLVLDRDLRVTDMNSAAEVLLACSRRQSEGMPVEVLAEGAQILVRGMRRCLQTQYPFTERELSIRPAGQREITVDCTVSPLPEEFGGGLLAEIRQVDQHLRISREEHLLAQQQTSRALIRNLAHEIKNPLGGLRGAAQLLERELGVDGLKEYTRILIGEADRLRGLVDRMLGPNRLPVYREVNVHEVMERVRNLVLAEIGDDVVIRQDYDPSIPALWGDADQLIQALLNIVRNAVQALRRSDPAADGRDRGRDDVTREGMILLRTRVQRQSTIGLRRHKLVARLEVIDNGPGIPKSIMEGIFFPTISGHAQGTGLGLSIAQSIVNQHNGLIECTSRPGRTVFTLLLPFEKSDEPAADEPRVDNARFRRGPDLATADEDNR